MRLSVEFLTAATTTTDFEARSFFRTFKDEQAAMVALVEGVVAAPGSSAAAETIDSSSFVIDAAMLKASDRLIAAYLKSIAPLVKAERLARDGGQALAFGACSPDTGDSEIDQEICEARIAGLDSARRWLGSIAVAAGSLAVVVALFTTGPLMMGLGAAAGIGLVLAGAAQLAYMCQSGQLAASFLAPDPPRLMETLWFQGHTMLATGSTAGAPITSAAMAGADAVTQVAARDTPAVSPAPKDGTIVTAPRTAAADTTREMISLQGNGNSAVATRIGVPSTQSTRTFAESRIAAPLANAIDGAYTGSLVWSRTDGKETGGGQEVLTFTVASGRITATAPFAASGSVNAFGVVTGLTGLSPAGFTCTFSGVLATVPATGSAAGGGSLGCAPKDGLFTWGSWSADRPATP